MIYAKQLDSLAYIYAAGNIGVS